MSPSADVHSTPPLGIIEGFFGRTWSWAARTDMVHFLARQGYNFYLYAPKADPHLRRHWQTPWPEDEWRALCALRDTCRAQGIRFGVGLSPLELYREPRPQSRKALTRKLQALNRLEPDLMGLLFDDMRGDLPELAERQVSLAHVAAEASSAEHLILCPTYYSFDPVLEKVFGTRPAGYWEHLGQNLDPSIDLFWTGQEVCSRTYPDDHLTQVSQYLQRRPFLWDNYPVNDSASLSPYLRLDAYPASHARLSGQVAGHAVNPMNQAYLSQIPLHSLPEAYRAGGDYRPEAAFMSATRACTPPELARHLIADRALLQERGLNALTDAERRGLEDRYQPFAEAGQPHARELLDWLNGGYAFDPACLTD
ncbi:beta-N-acetylglucosaminidase [Marinimicrobium koreense]|uniref:Beta-N-acetylglucosaminidase n=1 Tax=Marinimicrobium koreense TaxID=306545 RepID=A0A3N1NU97_9GAMM|nr:beta-N-acetylglucosaminidase domain-containing protein [Marinimicrobium koreense]ROQ19733.1 beta-N-acetylglucosaminidase [Marinimicrobium koreense]